MAELLGEPSSPFMPHIHKNTLRHCTNIVYY